MRIMLVVRILWRYGCRIARRSASQRSLWMKPTSMLGFSGTKPGQGKGQISSFEVTKQPLLHFSEVQPLSSSFPVAELEGADRLCGSLRADGILTLHRFYYVCFPGWNQCYRQPVVVPPWQIKLLAEAWSVRLWSAQHYIVIHGQRFHGRNAGGLMPYYWPVCHWTVQWHQDSPTQGPERDLSTAWEKTPSLIIAS